MTAGWRFLLTAAAVTVSPVAATAAATGSATPGTAPATVAAEPAVEVRPLDREGYARMLAAEKGRPVVVNMWATWCGPCRDEFPDLVRLHREMSSRGLRVVAVSLDTQTALRSEVIPFLQAQEAAFATYIKSAGDDEAFINAIDPRWSGALPATFVYDREGRLVESVLGPTSLDQLRKLVSPLLSKPE